MSSPVDPTRRLLDVLRIEVPIVSAPMARIAGGALAGEVSAAGGLGFVGGGYGDLDWIDEQLGLATGAARADVIVAQGNESGGHGRDNESLWTVLPATARAVHPTPVLAAGGVGTAEDLRRALRAGAAGAAVGTRLYASDEALDSAAAKGRLVERAAGDTVRTAVFDLLRGPRWPAGYTGQALSNAVVERWHGREADLRNELASEGDRYGRAAARDDLEVRVIWAGSGLDGIDRVAPAGDIVRAIAAGAMQTRRR